MKNYLNIILLIVFISSFLYSQEEKPETLNVVTPSFNSLQNLQYKFDEFEFYRELNYMKFKLPSISDSNTVWMWTRLAISNPGNQDAQPGNSPGDWIEPLHQQFLEDSKFNPVRYVLGMAQTAAVGYLAYQHIKKYGLFK